MNMKLVKFFGVALVAMLLPVVCFGQIKVVSQYQERFDEDMKRYCTVVLKNTSSKTATTYEFHIWGTPKSGNAFYVKKWSTTVKETILPGETKMVSFSLPSTEFEVPKIRLVTARYSDGSISYPESE